MNARKRLLSIMILMGLVILSGCSQDDYDMRDGYYSAEMSDFDEYGWKEFITIYVSGGKMLTVEYNARDASGYIKSWDMNYMRNMSSVSGTYPNEYTRSYAISLLNWQHPEEVDVVSGATHSHTKFQMLAEAAMTQARAGEKRVALVD